MSAVITLGESAEALPLWMSAAEVGRLAGICAGAVKREAFMHHRLVRKGRPGIVRGYHVRDVLAWLDSRGQLDPRWRAYLA